MWLKEYIYNALLQPLHMLIYFVFVSSAMSFATENIIYVLVVFLFMTQAEKILKQIFEFGRAPMGTVGGLSGGTSTALTLSALTSTASNVSNMIKKSRKGSSGDGESYGDYDGGIEGVAPSEPLDYTRFAGLNSGEGNGDFEPVELSGEGGNAGLDVALPTDEHYRGIYDTFSSEENERYRQLIGQGYNPEDAVEQTANEGYLDMLGSPLSTEEQKMYNDMTQKARYSPIDAMEMIANARRSRGVSNSSQESGFSQGGSDIEIPYVPEDREQPKLTAPKGTFASIKQMARRRANSFRYSASQIDKKKVLRGVSKGMAIGGAMVGAAGLVLGQAAVSIAMDGKYNPLEGVATFAGATIGITKLGGKAVNRASKLYDEFDRIKNGKDEHNRKKREKEFLSNKENFKEYNKKYGDMGHAKTAIEMARGAQYAGQGITNVNEQMQVAAYADSMVDEAFEKYYANKPKGQIAKDAKKIRENAEANGDKNLAKLTDKDIIKVSLRNTKPKNSSMTYEELAIQTLNARKEIGESVINSTKDKREAWIDTASGGNKEIAEGMKQAIEANKRMNLAVRNEKQRLNELKADYSQKAANEKAQIEEDKALDSQIKAMQDEAKNHSESGTLSSDETVRDWQIALSAINNAKKNNGVLKREDFKKEIESKYLSTFGTNIDNVVDNTMSLLEGSGCILSATSPINDITLSKSSAEKKLASYMKKQIKQNVKKRK